MASRYDNLNAAISNTVNDSKKNKPYRIVEIGIHHAVRAVAMIKLAKKLGRSNIEYYGFDLFEDMTPEVNANEFGKPALALSREDIRQKLVAAGAVKVQLVKGDTKLTLENAVKDIPTANVVFVDGGHSIETIANDLEHILKVCGPKTSVLLDDCYPTIYDKGCAFLSKCFGLLKDDYGITVEEVGPTDVFDKNPYGAGPLHIKFIKLTCAAQLTPAKLKGLGDLLISTANPVSKEQEPTEFFPEKSFVEEPAAPTVCSKGASEAAGDSFQGAPAFNSCSNSDVQPVRVCENSCGNLPGEHCERTGDSCGRRESAVEPACVDKVSSEEPSDLQICKERQEPDQVVEQGDTAGLGAPCADNSGGELRPEVSSPMESGNRRVSRRRRRRGGADDERSGPQA